MLVKVINFFIIDDCQKWSEKCFYQLRPFPVITTAKVQNTVSRSQIQF